MLVKDVLNSATAGRRTVRVSPAPVESDDIWRKRAGTRNRSNEANKNYTKFGNPVLKSCLHYISIFKFTQQQLYKLRFLFERSLFFHNSTQLPQEP